MCAQVSRGALNQRNSKVRDVQVSIVGLTRLSASFGHALREYSSRANSPLVFSVMGHSDDQQLMKTAQSVGAIDSYHKDLAGTLAKASIVIVDIPMGRQMEMFEEMARHFKPGAVVIDLAPLKQPGVELAKKFFPKNSAGKLEVYIIGATPLVRFEELYNNHHDVAASQPNLFGTGDILVVPDASMPAESVKVVSDIADFLKLSPRFMDPAEHDALAGLTETLPVLQSALYFNTIQKSRGQIDILRTANLTFAQGVQNMHGLSASDFATTLRWNKDLVLQQIEQMAVALESIREVMMDNNPETLDIFAQQVIDGFTEWEIRRRENRWDEDVADIDTMHAGTFGGMISTMFSSKRKKDGEA